MDNNLYAYMVLDAETVFAALGPADPAQPDAFLSHDHQTAALKEVIAKGYRWIRTDGNHAIFEKSAPHDHRNRIPIRKPTLT